MLRRLTTAVVALVTGLAFGNERLGQHISTIYGTVGEPIVNAETGQFFVDLDFADIDNFGGAAYGEEAQLTVTGIPDWMQWYGQNVQKDTSKRQFRESTPYTYWYPQQGAYYNPVVGIPTRPGEWTITVKATWPDNHEESQEVKVSIDCVGDYTYNEATDPIVTHYPIIACRVGQPLKNPFTGGDYVDVDLADVDCRQWLHPDQEETITVTGLPPWLTWEGVTTAKNKSKLVTRSNIGTSSGSYYDPTTYGWWYAVPNGTYYPIHGTPTEVGEWIVRIKAAWKGGVSGTVSIRVRSVPDSVFCTLSLDANGGTVESTKVEGVYGDVIGYLPIPNRGEEWTFLGWYTAKKGGKKITADDTFGTSMTLYAHWKSANGPNVVEPISPFTAQKASVLNGALYTDEGNLAGVIQLKVAKPNAKKHSTKVSGSVTLLDGKKRTLKATTVNVPVNTPIVANVSVKGLGTLSVDIGNDGFGGTLGGYTATSAKVGGKWTRTDTVVSVGFGNNLPEGTQGNLLPDAVPIRPKGGKWTFDKAASIKYSKGVLSGNTDPKKPNLSAMKLTYVPKTGLFKGSFKIYAVQNGKLKKYTVKVSGVVVEGSGAGLAKLAKPAATWELFVE